MSRLFFICLFKFCKLDYFGINKNKTNKHTHTIDKVALFATYNRIKRVTILVTKYGIFNKINTQKCISANAGNWFLFFYWIFGPHCNLFARIFMVIFFLLFGIYFMIRFWFYGYCGEIISMISSAYIPFLFMIIANIIEKTNT